MSRRVQYILSCGWLFALVQDALRKPKEVTTDHGLYNQGFFTDGPCVGIFSQWIFGKICDLEMRCLLIQILRVGTRQTKTMINHKVHTVEWSVNQVSWVETRLFTTTCDHHISSRCTQITRRTSHNTVTIFDTFKFRPHITQISHSQ